MLNIRSILLANWKVCNIVLSTGAIRESNGTPLQYSCLENPMDGGAWKAAVHVVATERLHFHFSLSCIGEGNGNPLQCSCLKNPRDGAASWAAIYGVAQSRTQLSDFPFTFHFHALEKEMATHSSVLAWRIPGTGEPGGLPSMGLQRVGHDWRDLAVAVSTGAMLYSKSPELIHVV